MKDEVLDHNIITLHSRGWSIRRLSREFGVGRKRITRIIEKHHRERENGANRLEEKVKAPSKLDPWKPYIGELLEEFSRPPITNRRIFELSREKGYQGGQSILRDYLVEVRGKKTPEAVYCVETAPGQRGYHDWSDYLINFTVSGTQKVIFFSFVLGYSRRQYIEVVTDKTQPVLLRAMINAFIYFKGVPRQIRSDNQKACVDRWELGRPVYNKTYLGFCTHYRFVQIPFYPDPSFRIKLTPHSGILTPHLSTLVQASFMKS